MSVRRIPASLLLVLLILPSCKGGGTTSPVPEPPISDGSGSLGREGDQPRDPSTLDPHEGTVIVDGTSGSGTGYAPPVQLKLEGPRDSVAIVGLTATPTDPTLPLDGSLASIARLTTWTSGSSITGVPGRYSVMAVPANGVQRYFAHRIKRGGEQSLGLYNQPGEEAPQNAADVTWDYRYDVVPLSDASENLSTSLGEPQQFPLIGNQTFPGTFFRDQADGDTVDEFAFELNPSKGYTLEFSNTNGHGMDWRYSFELDLAPDRPSIRGEISAANFSYTFAPSEEAFGDGGTLRIRASEVARSSDFTWGQYWLTLTERGGLTSPQVLGVRATGPAGGTIRESLTADFEVDCSSTVSRSIWDLGSGTAAQEIQGTHLSIKPKLRGTYTGSVQVFNVEGASAIFPFSYSVLPGPPSVGSIVVEPRVWSPSEPATIKGEDPKHQPSSWYWEFPEGVTPRTSTAVAPVINVAWPGRYEFLVTVTNDYGPVTRTQHFSLTRPEGAPTVRGVTQLEGCSGGSMRPLIDPPPPSAYWDFGEGATPRTWDGPSGPNVTLGAPGIYHGFVVPMNENGPGPIYAFSYAVRSADGPCGSSHPLPQISDPVEADYVLAMCNAGPIVFSRAYDSSSSITAWVSRVLVPGHPTDWVTYEMTGGSSSHGWSAASVEGTTILMVSGAPGLHQTTANPPLSATDWSLVPVPEGPNRTPSVAVVNGRPVIALHDRPARILTLWQASKTEPSTTADWVVTSFPHYPGAYHLRPTLTVSPTGHLGVGYQTGYRYWYVRALTPAPDGIEDFRIHSVSGETDLSWGKLLQTPDGPILFASNRWAAPDPSSQAFYLASSPDPDGPADWQLAYAPALPRATDFHAYNSYFATADRLWRIHTEGYPNLGIISTAPLDRLADPDAWTSMPFGGNAQFPRGPTLLRTAPDGRVVLLTSGWLEDFWYTVIE